MGEEQLKVLQLIDDGIISADDGILLLNTLAPIPVAESEQAFEAPPSRILQADDEVSPSGGSLSHLPFWRRFWLYPLLLGGSFVILGFTYTIMPELRDLNPNDLVEALAKTSTQGVFSVDVQEGDSEHVRVFYG